MSVDVEEMLAFLSPQSRVDVRCIAMQYFLGLTGTDEGQAFLASNDKYLSAITDLISDKQEAIAKDALLALVNLSTEEIVCNKLLKLSQHPDLDRTLLLYILDKDSPHADIACTILSNLSRSEPCSEKILDTMLADETIGFERLIFAFCHKDYNKQNKLHYIGPFLSNLTQIKRARLCVMDKTRCVIERLLPFVQYENSMTRRGGVVGALHNCCFERDFHEWLLNEDGVDILPRLLLPLAGPEEFDDDDMEKLPADLQYLDPDKKREPDADIRRMLVESVHQLCTLKVCRDYVKEKNTYVILRELHRWEKDPRGRMAIENLVSLLISDEPTVPNLDEVEIPDHIEEVLLKVDADAEKAIVEEMAQTSLEAKPTSDKS